MLQKYVVSNIRNKIVNKVTTRNPGIGILFKKSAHITIPSKSVRFLSTTKCSAAMEDPTTTSDLESLLSRKIVDLEELDNDLFRASEKQLWKPGNARGVYGGQIIGQSLIAAARTVPSEYHIHSCHSYFLIPGNVERDVIYHVDRTREGKSFHSRNVKAVQNGRAILTTQISYHRDEDSSMEYQVEMPKVPGPDELPTMSEILNKLEDEGNTVEQMKLKAKFLQPDAFPVDIKIVEPAPLSWYVREPKAPRAMVWVKALGHIGEHNNLHRAVAAYVSDWTLLLAALFPVPNLKIGMMASIDHSMWFHRHFKADDWMLYETECTLTAHNRAMTYGRLWRRDGTLAVSVAQEGLIRARL